MKFTRWDVLQFLTSIALIVFALVSTAMAAAFFATGKYVTAGLSALISAALVVVVVRISGGDS